MAPKTHTLQQYGTEIDCSIILPSAYLIEGIWLSTPENSRLKQTPQILKPGTTWSWAYKGPDHLMNTGLYSKDAIYALQRHLLFPQDVDAAQNNLARQTMGYDVIDQGLKLRPFIDEEVISKLVEEKLQKMWGWFVGFGNFISGLLGIFCAWKILIICLSTTLNISILYQTFGCSIQILAGIFSSSTHYVMHKTHTLNNKHEIQSKSNPTAPLDNEISKYESPVKQQTHILQNIYPTLPEFYNQVQSNRKSF